MWNISSDSLKLCEDFIDQQHWNIILKDPFFILILPHLEIPHFDDFSHLLNMDKWIRQYQI